MARSETTHVLEIESGIGEPAFIPLTLGQELSPISVGKKGMWRIESPRVLDVHAFVYFDGAALFIQSADEQSAAMVDGQPVGKAWTELAAPCRIEIGQARLRFRSLMPAPLEEQEERTVAFEVPVQKHGTLQMTPSAVGLQPASPSAARGIPAKPERPFAPGEFSHRSDDATRVAPLETSKAGRRPGGDESMRAAVRPAAGMPPSNMSASGGYAVPHTSPSGQPLIMHTPNGMPGMPHGAMQPSMSHSGGVPVPMTPVHNGPMSGGMPSAYGSGPYPAPPNGYPAPPPSGQLPQGPYGPPLPPGMSMPPGSMQPLSHGGAAVPTESKKKDDFATRWKEMSAVRRLLILMSPLILASAYYAVVVDDPPPTTKGNKGTKTASSGSGAVASTARDAGSVATTTAAPGVSGTAPPPVDPGAQVGGPPVGSAPTAVGSAPTSPAPAGSAPPPGSATGRTVTPPPGPSAVAGAPLVDGKRTLERIAIDAYLAGDYPLAARSYEQLAEMTPAPSNIVYLEAARIIKAKVETRQR